MAHTVHGAYLNLRHVLILVLARKKLKELRKCIQIEQTREGVWGVGRRSERADASVDT